MRSPITTRFPPTRPRPRAVGTTQRTNTPRVELPHGQRVGGSRTPEADAATQDESPEEAVWHEGLSERRQRRSAALATTG